MIPRRLFLAASSGLALPARAETPADENAIRDTITRQIDAFRRDDADAAFALAAPNIHQRFGTAERFMGLVQHAYPQVYRPRAVEFTALRFIDGTVTQDVELTGPDGAPALARYTLEQNASGAWRITGCSILESTRLAV